MDSAFGIDFDRSHSMKRFTKKTLKLLGIPTLALFLMAVGCDGGNSDSAELMDLGMAMEEADRSSFRSASPVQTKEESVSIEQKLIKSGNIEFQSKDISIDYEKIKSLLPAYQAYIEGENQSRSDYRITYNLTIRVPAISYDSLFGDVTSIAYKLDNKNSNIQDVTERYYDLENRIKNKKVLEERYRDLLDQATEIKDILEIERNLNQVRTEIEGLEGQFRYLSKQIGYSTLSVSFYEVLPYTFDGDQRPGFGARVLNALDNGWQGFLTFLVGVTSLWPFVILFFILRYLFRKLNIRWKRKKE